MPLDTETTLHHLEALLVSLRDQVDRLAERLETRLLDQSCSVALMEQALHRVEAELVDLRHALPTATTARAALPLVLELGQTARDPHA